MTSKAGEVDMILNPIKNVDRMSERIESLVPDWSRHWLECSALTNVRIIAALAQAGTILVTWKLWQVREFPPLLPAVNVPQVDMGWVLLLTLVVVLIRPRVGIPLHVGLLVLSMLLDETRIQPYAISIALLMLGTLPVVWCQSLACTHLVALWFYAGFHKIVSVYVNGYVSSNFFLDIVPWLPDPVPQLLALGVLFSEMGLGLLALRLRTRKLAAVLAVALHVGLFAALVLRGQNTAVWLWQFPLALGGLVFLWNWSLSIGDTFARQSVAGRAVLAFVLISPLGFYFGVIDPYLAHCLYSGNAAGATIRSADGEEVRVSAAALNAVMPPAPRLFEMYFERVAHPGDVLIIKEKSLWCRLFDGVGDTTKELQPADHYRATTDSRSSVTGGEQ